MHTHPTNTDTSHNKSHTDTHKEPLFCQIPVSRLEASCFQGNIPRILRIRIDFPRRSGWITMDYLVHVIMSSIITWHKHSGSLQQKQAVQCLLKMGRKSMFYSWLKCANGTKVVTVQSTSRLREQDPNSFIPRNMEDEISV